MIDRIVELLIAGRPKLKGLVMNNTYILVGHDAVPEPDIHKWAAWFDKANRVVQVDIVNGVRVSTVFVGIDHSFGDDGPPLLFETMVFGGKLDTEERRYSTWEDAEHGHKLMCLRVEQEGGQ